MAKKRKDQLGFMGLVSTILKNRSQQKSMMKARNVKGIEPEPEPKVKRPKETRSTEEIRAGVDATRTTLVETVARIRYDLDVPARAKDLRDRTAARVPAEYKGEPAATVIAGLIFAAGTGIIAGLAALRGSRPR